MYSYYFFLLGDHFDTAQPEIIEGVMIPTRFEFSDDEHPIPVVDFIYADGGS